MDMGTSTMAMDMASSTMSMAMSATSTGSAAAATTSAAMDMGMDMGGDCKISMLWNWYTIDACFLSSTWHIKSKGMFAGSCIGVILLVMSLEFLRRLGKEYDRYSLRQYQRSYTSISVSSPSSGPGKSSDIAGSCPAAIPPFRPHLVQQLVRATLHMLQFGVAYIIMLLAMYFNGYIIICIIIGAWLGAFVFSWETISLGSEGGVKEEVTVCCG